jgi:hypothetical protein
VANADCVGNDGRGNGDKNSKASVTIPANMCPSRVSCATAPIMAIAPFSESCQQPITSNVTNEKQEMTMPSGICYTVQVHEGFLKRKLTAPQRAECCHQD